MIFWNPNGYIEALPFQNIAETRVLKGAHTFLETFLKLVERIYVKFHQDMDLCISKPLLSTFVQQMSADLSDFKIWNNAKTYNEL